MSAPKRGLSRSRDAQSTVLRHSYALRFTDSLATTTLAFVVPLAIYAITHNLAWSGLSFMLEWLPRLTAIPTAGPFVDQLGAPRFFLIANGLRAGVMCGAGIWLWQFPHCWIALVVVAIIAGMLAESTFVAAEKLGIEVAGSRPMHQVQAMQVGIDQVVQVGGPVVGGLLLAINVSLTFMIIAILLCGSLYYTWLVQRSPLLTKTDEVEELAGLWPAMRSGWHTILQHKQLLYVIGNSAAFNLLLALLLAVTPAVVEQRFHLSTKSVGLLWSLAAVASVAAVGAATRIADKFGILAIGFVSSMVSCGACLAAALAQSYWAYAAAITIFMAMDASCTVFIRTARARMIPKKVYGATVGVIVLLSLAPYPLAGALVAVVPLQSIPALLVVCTALVGAFSCWSFARMARSILNGKDRRIKHNHLQLAQEYD